MYKYTHIFTTHPTDDEKHFQAEGKKKNYTKVDQKKATPGNILRPRLRR